MTVHDMASLRAYISVLEAERTHLQQRIREQWEPETREAYDEGLHAGHRDVLPELRCWEAQTKAAQLALQDAQQREKKTAERVCGLNQDKVGWIILCAAGWMAFGWHIAGRLLWGAW